MAYSLTLNMLARKTIGRFRVAPSQFQSEAKCEAIDMKMSFFCFHAKKEMAYPEGLCSLKPEQIL